MKLITQITMLSAATFALIGCSDSYNDDNNNEKNNTNGFMFGCTLCK